MSRYVKRPRPQPTSEEFMALVVLLGPLAWVARWIWCGLRAAAGAGDVSEVVELRRDNLSFSNGGEQRCPSYGGGA